MMARVSRQLFLVLALLAIVGCGGGGGGKSTSTANDPVTEKIVQEAEAKRQQQSQAAKRNPQDLSGSSSGDISNP